jgi:hypothetical protein
MKIELRLTDDRGRSFHGVAELQSAEVGSGSDLPGASVSATLDGNSLPARILALREAGFFHEPRTPAEVHAKLSETYHCLMNRVQMALLRLHRKRELRKAIKRVGPQEHAAYVW